MIKFKRVQALFMDKYPTGSINVNHLKAGIYSIHVAFTAGGKLYTYRVSSYGQLVNVLDLGNGRPVLTESDVVSLIKRLNDIKQDLVDIKAGVIKPNIFGFKNVVPSADHQQEMLVTIDKYEKMLSSYILI